MSISKPKSRLHTLLKQMREALYADVLAEVVAHPERTYSQIAAAHGVSVATVQRVAQRHNISRPVGPRPQAETIEPQIQTAEEKSNG